jgi:hypothetical protein
MYYVNKPGAVYIITRQTKLGRLENSLTATVSFMMKNKNCAYALSI